MSAKRVNGPGTWAFVSLTDQFEKVGWSKSSIPEEYIWEKVELKRGGVIPLERLHSTVLLRLDTKEALRSFRETVDESEPIEELTIVDLHVSKVGRLSTEFEEEVYSLGASITCPKITDFRNRFLETLWEHELEAGNVKDDPAEKKKLFEHHDPYHYTRDSDAHCSLAYVKGEFVEQVEKLRDELLNEFKANGILGTAPKVTALYLKFQDRDEKFLLGKFLPAPQRAISFDELTKIVTRFKGKPGASTSGSQNFATKFTRGLSALLSRAGSTRNTFEINKGTTTADVVANIIVPATTQKVQNYATFLSNSGHEESVGKVDYFVSHAWQYKFLDLYDSISQHYERVGKQLLKQDPSKKQVYYWLDIFAVNQHNIKGKGEISELWNVVQQSRQTVIVLQPWDRPVALTRIWCLYELLSTMEASKVLNTESNQLSVEIPSSELGSFHKTLTSNFPKIRESITTIDSANAQATNPLDLDNIRDQIEKTVGYSALNTLIKDQLRQWLVQAGLSQLQSLSGSSNLEEIDFGSIPVSRNKVEWAETVQFAHQLALVMGDVGKYDTAQKLYEKVLAEREKVNGTVHIATISCGSDLGFLLTKRRQPERAVELLTTYIAALEEVIEQWKARDDNQSKNEKPSTRKSFKGKPKRTSFSDKYGLQFLESINQRGASKQHYSGLAGLQSLRLLMKNNRAMALGALSDEHVAEAMKEYKEVLNARVEQYGTDQNADSMSTLNNLAWLLAKHNKQEDAKPLFERVVAFRAKEHGEKSPPTLNARQNLAQTLLKLHQQGSKQGDLAKARDLLVSVCEDKLENMGLENRSTLSAMVILLECLSLLGDEQGTKYWVEKVRTVDSGTLATFGIDERLKALNL